ncbi:hypothetical protein CGLO_14755 [Colletotrichum gloeosporioides Cg-14]|uniref:Uncharacterized protein n=1 Tax=Colletotrichum gloeosporioides (strain Cg-14) TaxID=1237896 RepID=T0LD04_COLGC|nr:hypothetical protein CGLO_14755 [Colletotrichum gloeosporioides Cg-14]
MIWVPSRLSCKLKNLFICIAPHNQRID